MRHTYECPMRWADMDMLGHVNNVTYIDYLQEARIDLFATHDAFRGRHDGSEGAVVVDYQVEFLAPLVFRRRPILVDVWVSQINAASFTLEYEIYDIRDAERVTHLRASSQLAPYVFESSSPRRLSPTEREWLTGLQEPIEPRAAIGGPPLRTTVTPLRLRFTDLDVFKHANNVQFFEFFQESRIHYLMDLHKHGETWAHHVVARTDIEFVKPIHYRRTAYDVHNWISHVGSRSFTISAEIRDGDEVMARSHVVMVTFDAETQRSAPMPSDQRQSLMRELED